MNDAAANGAAIERDASEFSVDGARRAAERDDLETWVRRFLASAGSDNAELGDQLTAQPRWWTGPLRLPIGELHRLVGPSDDPVLRAVDENYWGDDVDDMAEQIDDAGWQPAPVVVTYRDDQLVLEDGNHRVEALRRSGEDEAWAVVGFDSIEARDRFSAPGDGRAP